MLRKKQYTCEATIVPSIALDDGEFLHRSKWRTFWCIKVVEYMILSLVSPWPKFSVLFWLLTFKSKSKSIPFLIESPCINISPTAETSFHTRHAVYASIIIQSILVEWGLNVKRYKRCLFTLWQSRPGWLQRLTEHLKCDQWYGDTMQYP